MKLTRKQFLGIAAGTVVAAGAGRLVHAIDGHDAGPRSTPAEAKRRLGMAIDLRTCREEKGCDHCIEACNLAHNVPRIPDPAHEVKWIWSEPYARVFPFQESAYTRETSAGLLPILCNHCQEPACVRVCPTGATWKRQDGVVMMDYHRCIGCRYCMAACPYGSRSFNFVDPRPYVEKPDPDFPTRAKGVVEKCNFCEERLAEGGLPACVKACARGALLFGDLNDEHSALRQALATRYSMQRRPELGCGPSIFYLV